MTQTGNSASRMSIIEDTSTVQLQTSPAGVRDFLGISYGVSLHWGLYALIGRGEWVMHEESIPVPEYEKLMQQFNPIGFSAQEWVNLVKDSEAELLTITAKHHDGFCMYDTALTDYKITNTTFERDPIGELAEACHRSGIFICFYYSLLDWHHPAYRTDWPAYVDYYQGQVREICTKYGELGAVIFDGYWPRFEITAETEYFAPGGPWNLADTYDLVHTLQPRAMIANNHHMLPLRGEDFQVFEMDMPGENTAGFNTTEIGSLPLLTWFTVNRGWSYSKLVQQAVKPSYQLIDLLGDSAARNAKCFLNVGPTPSGEILVEEQAALRRVGAWLRESESECLRVIPSDA